MKYDLKKPCDNCPFKKQGGVSLREGRIYELADSCTTNPGAEFACHKTTVPGEEDREIVEDTQHCAGALVFADKQDCLGMAQMHRIVMRIGMFDPRKLEGHDEVWDDVDQWVDEGSC